MKSTQDNQTRQQNTVSKTKTHKIKKNGYKTKIYKYRLHIIRQTKL